MNTVKSHGVRELIMAMLAYVIGGALVGGLLGYILGVDTVIMVMWVVLGGASGGSLWATRSIDRKWKKFIKAEQQAKGEER